MRDMAAVALIALALFTLIVLAAARVWKVRTSKARKLEALHRLEGQLVRVGMNAVAQNFVIEHTGIMRLGQRHDAVLLEGKGIWSVPITHIRWVVDPGTGQRIAGPW